MATPRTAPTAFDASTGHHPGVGTWMGRARRRNGAVELTGPLGDRPRPDQTACILVDDPVPRRWVEVPGDALGADASVLESAFSSPADPDPAPLAGTLSVVVCTRDRPDTLRSGLARLAALDGDYPIVVVDNAPTSDATQRVVDEARAAGLPVRRVVEPRPGLSRARNRGLADAGTDLVAFTDDDALVEPDWARALHAGFGRAPDVAVVTGLTPPAEIATPAQARFQTKMHWTGSLDSHVYTVADRERYPWAFPYAAGRLGAGVNFAVRRRVVLDLGGFDEQLGAGRRTGGGEDPEIFVRSLLAGHALAYEPAAIVWHVHRRTDAELRAVLYNYAKGLSATFVVHLRRGNRLDVARQVVKGLADMGRHRGDELAEGAPLSLVLVELAGAAAGPFAYAAECWADRRAGG